MSLTTVSVSLRWVIRVLYHSYHLCLWLYCNSITKMSDTCTLSQLSPMSPTTVIVSLRWVIRVLYHSYHLCLWLYCNSITKMSDTCTLSQLSPMSLTTVTFISIWLYNYEKKVMLNNSSNITNPNKGQTTQCIW